MHSESSIEHQILDYLAANPEAQDTLRGILEWWLPKQRIVETKIHVEAALTRLICAGKLMAQPGLDGQVHYCLTRKARLAASPEGDGDS